MPVTVDWRIRRRSRRGSQAPPPGSGHVAPTMPDAMVGERYQHQLQVAGPGGDYEWEKTEGDLPVGLTLGTLGMISGTPRHDGIARFKVQYTGGDGQPSSPYPVSLTVHRQLKITRDLSLRS